MRKILIVLVTISILVSACTSLFPQPEPKTVIKYIPIDNSIEKYPYQASEKRVVDLLNTQLEVRFDWEKQQLFGKAELTMIPYFYQLKNVDIDAKGMEIKSVSFQQLDSVRKIIQPKFKYDSLQIHVELPIQLTRKDSFKVFIEYVSKPNEWKAKGSNAIKDDKGLYFINPLGRDTYKPQQLWTQGETESSSVWFPTIDAPNEKTTQEIFITVDKQFNTLSNGLLIDSKENADGTKTDHWKQEMPHAPYLFMMAVGKFAVVQDQWQGIPVNYLVDPKDSTDARSVFGNTPEMLSFYSEKLGYKYPWEKYNQVVVSDYVSGAMENTGAVIHGRWVFKNKTQQIDGNHEDVIAHELFHHWFGDLVTCESWSNLPLNESFATYGEYLWFEYKYGKIKADRHLQLDLHVYLEDTPRVDLIRYHYDDKEDMFDGHSYQKGGRILHMLRDYVGDDAFFAALKLYLHRHAFSTVEVHDLRLAFEETTGEDLNWFFNQWFLDKGHPELKVDYKVQSDSLLLTVEQTQSKEFPTFKFPVSIDFYEGGTPRREEIWITKQKETFLFEVDGEPELVNFDAKKVLLAEIDFPITPEQALVKYSQGKLYKDKLEALLSIRRDTSMAAWEVLDKASRDTFEHFRKISYLLNGLIPDGETEDHKEKLLQAFASDKSSIVRSVVLNQLRTTWPSDSSLIPIYKKALGDSSNLVKQYGLYALSKIAREDALLRAHDLEQSTDPGVIISLADLYSDVKDESKRKWYNWAMKQVEARNKKSVIQAYAEYLKSKGNEVVWRSCKNLKEEAIYENNKDVREAATMAIHVLRQRNIERIIDIKKDIRDKREASKGKPYDLKILIEKYEELKAHDERLKTLLQEIYDKEVNHGLKKKYDEYGIVTLDSPSELEEAPVKEGETKSE